MPKEIERKFLVHTLPFDEATYPFVSIAQGYLALESDGQEVRLRRKGQQYFLTVKSAGTMVREEYETSLTPEQFQTLWPGTAGRRLQKDRYIFEGQMEVDIYRGNLAGLIVAEIEFPDQVSAKSFQAPSWVEQEITHLNFLKNRNLFQFKNWAAILDAIKT